MSSKSQISQTGEVLLDQIALFNLKSVNPQPESGSVAKDMVGKNQVHVFRHLGIKDAIKQLH
eukprot:1136976-Pelagomonas_calceolata.AAC.2